MSSPTDANLAWDFILPALTGGTLDFAAHKGNVLLVVNTASMCGYTPQYESLQQLHETLGPRGLSVIGIPSGDFRQEYADDAAVKTFCEKNYGVEFPLASISHVKGAAAIPFYTWVRAQCGGWEPAWNFNKVLIDRNGRVGGHFAAGDDPGTGKLATAIHAALAGDV